MLNKTMQSLGSQPSVIRETFEYGNALAAKIGRENVFDYSLGNPSSPPPPWVRQTLSALNEDENATALHGYTSAAGAPSVRRAIAEDLDARLGANCAPQDIFMTCGAAASLTVSLHALCNAGDEVIVFAPFFPEYRVFVEGAGAALITVPPLLPSFSVDFAALEAALGKNCKALILNTPNNPSGAVLSEETLRALGALLRRKEAEYGHAIYLISDEPYRELTWEEAAPRRAVTQYYDDALICYSFSKSLSLPGERIGYIAIGGAAAEKEALRDAVAGAARMLGFVCAPAMMQYLVAAHPAKTSDFSAYLENRKILTDALRAMGYSFVPPQGAFYLFLKAPAENAAAFCAKAREENLLLVPSDSFGMPGYVRISYCVKTDMVRRSLAAFSRLAAHYGLQAQTEQK